MPQRRATIGSAKGLHARPAALFARAAASSGRSIGIARVDAAPVQASSLLLVMALNLGHGEEVVLSTDDDAATPLLDELAALLSKDLDAA